MVELAFVFMAGMAIGFVLAAVFFRWVVRDVTREQPPPAPPPKPVRKTMWDT